MCIDAGNGLRFGEGKDLYSVFYGVGHFPSVDIGLVVLGD